MFAAAVVLGGAFAPDAQAQVPFQGQPLGTRGPIMAKINARNGGVAFQAAPWYLYWPYDAHFQLPAPVAGGYSPPPSMGGYPSLPFFPYSSAYVPGSPLNYYPYGPTVAPGYAR